MAEVKQTNGVTAPQAVEATPAVAPPEATNETLTKEATPTPVTNTPAEPKKTKLVDRILAKIKSLINKKEKTTTSPAAPTPAVTKATAEPNATTTTPAAPEPASAVPATAATA